jgi:hypothetical protein
MGTNTPKPSRPSRTLSLQQLIAGLNKHQATFTSAMVDGAQLTTAQVVSKLGEILTTSNLVVTTHASWQAAVKADLAERVNTATFVSGVRQAILVAFNGQVDVLADFGLTQRKPRVLTPAQKQAAAAKAKATRAARHTMGKKQKAQITGATAPAGAAAPPPATAPAQAPAATPAPAGAPPSPTLQQ